MQMLDKCLFKMKLAKNPNYNLEKYFMHVYSKKENTTVLRLSFTEKNSIF